MKKHFEMCPKCGSCVLKFNGYNGDGVYMLGASFDCVNCGHQYEVENPGVVMTNKSILSHYAEDVMDKMDRRLTSGNSVEMESARITKEEYDILKRYIKFLENK